MDKEILELFGVMVVSGQEKSDTPILDLVDHGLVLDFVPTPDQKKTLKTFNTPLNIKTMFSRTERDTADPLDLITKQILNYIETYGLGMPGLLNLESESGQIVQIKYVQGVTQTELDDRVRNLLYTNAAIGDAEILTKIIQTFNVSYDINQISNNELRVALFDPQTDTFDNGDDFVRYVCYKATGEYLLIKSKEVLDAVRLWSSQIKSDLLERHQQPLAQVFNRHKKIIMNLKTPVTRTAINQISRLSKTAHVPVRESINKTFVTKALANDIDLAVLDKISVRDKFKYLNLLAYKRQQNTNDAFIIRNGKIHIEPNRKVWSLSDIDRVENAVITSLSEDLSGLKDQTILLDPNVQLGLPISRKQTVGQLPFGTKVKVQTGKISAGIYWENAWGATDLDLSTIDRNGQRTGWGQYSGYDHSNPITYSGDMTYADNGAMEFMTSQNQAYGLFVNIYSGQTGCGMELVVGEDSDNSNWIDHTVIREKTKLNSRGMVIGFVRNSEFVVWQGRIGGSRVSGGTTQPYVSRGMSEFWTVNDLLERIGIDFVLDNDAWTMYDYDMTYAGFSYDKLESLLL